MPRFRPKGMLERSALADLWKHTLSQIPTRFGRLVYLSSLRDPNSGNYHHHGLNAAFGKEEGTRALRESHERTFADWLNLSLEEKSADLTLYLQNLEDPQTAVAQYWLRSEQHVSQIPGSALPMERELFRRDLEALLQIVMNRPPAEAPAPGPSQPE